MHLQVLALPAPSAGPASASLHPGTRPPFIPSTGVGGVRPMGAVNGGCPANSGANHPSVTDIAAGAQLLASVVQGLHCVLCLRFNCLGLLWTYPRPIVL